jgi:hypothetical protein
VRSVSSQFDRANLELFPEHFQEDAMRIVTLVMISAIALLSGCGETARATSVPTPKERVTECEQVCTDVGMKLAAFVVMMSSSGCVCEPKSGPTVSKTSAAAAAAAGGVTVAAARASEQQEQELAFSAQRRQQEEEEERRRRQQEEDDQRRRQQQQEQQ